MVSSCSSGHLAVLKLKFFVSWRMWKVTLLPLWSVSMLDRHSWATSPLLHMVLSRISNASFPPNSCNVMASFEGRLLKYCNIVSTSQHTGLGAIVLGCLLTMPYMNFCIKVISESFKGSLDNLRIITKKLRITLNCLTLMCVSYAK